ncbi:MAG TPA: hypothetical protein VK210_14080, partial [Terriglobia bacterium]|nr:hypothetical protein [Terriglobia bacterium]
MKQNAFQDRFSSVAKRIHPGVRALLCVLLVLVVSLPGYSQGTPSLSAAIASQGPQSGSYLVELRVANSGTGLARNVRINTITLRTLAGTGTATLVSSQTTLPILLGDMPSGSTSTVQIFVSLPATVTRFSLTENGTLQNSAGSNLSFSYAQSVIPPANKAPVVDAGADQTITLPDLVTLAGTVADDGLPLGASLAPTWTKVSGPGTVTFDTPNSVFTTATFGQAGTYILRLSVSDGPLVGTDDVGVMANVPISPLNLSVVPTVSPTFQSSQVLKGSVDGANGGTSVTISGGASAASQRLAANQGQFGIRVPLKPNAENSLAVTATDDSGRTASAYNLNVVQLTLSNLVTAQVTARRLSTPEVQTLVADGTINISNPSNFNVSMFSI